MHYSLQQINTDLGRILKLLSTQRPAFTYPSVTQAPLLAEPVMQPFADSARGSRVTPVYPESSHVFQAQAPYQSGPESLHLRGTGVPVPSGHQGQPRNL